LARGTKTLTPSEAGVVTRLSAEAVAYDTVFDNIATGINILSVSQTALSSISTILLQMKSLATQSTSAGLTSSDLAILNSTFQNLASQIANLQTGASVNGVNLLTSDTGMTVTTGINGDAASNTTVAGFDLTDLAATIAGLSLIATTLTLASDTTGSAAPSGTAAIDTVTINGGSPIGGTSTVALTNSQGTLTFTNAAAAAFIPTIGTHVTYSAGGSATSASDVVTFNNSLYPIDTLILAGLTIRTTNGVTPANLKAALQDLADGTTFSNYSIPNSGTINGTLTGYSTTDYPSISNSVKFTKTTGDGTLEFSTGSAFEMGFPTIGTHVAYSSGAATSAADTATFFAMTAGQAVTLAGLTFTAGTSGATAANVAAAFASRAVGYTGGTVDGGVTTGTLTGYATGAASGSNGVVFTSTATSNVTLTATAQHSVADVANAFTTYINNSQQPLASTGAFSGTNLTMYSAAVTGTGNSAQLVLTQKSGQHGTSTLTNSSNTAITNSTTGVAASAGVKAVDHVTFSALSSGQSISVGGLTFTAGSSLTKGAVAQAYFDYINSATVPGSTIGVFSGTNQATITALYYAADSAANAAALTGASRTTSGLATDGILYFGGRSVGASALAITGIDAATNANAAIASLTTQITSVSIGQSIFSASSTGLTAHKAASSALQTGLTKTVDQIQNIDATAMQARLQQLNNQQSIDYYLVSQMNNAAAAILTIFR